MVAVRVEMVMGKSDDREGKGRKRRAWTVAKTDASRHLDRELAHSQGPGCGYQYQSRSVALWHSLLAFAACYGFVYETLSPSISEIPRRHVIHNLCMRVSDMCFTGS